MACKQKSHEVIFTALVVYRRHDEVRIEFASKGEKWAFIKHYLPEMVKPIEHFGASFGFAQTPILLVNEEWLKALSGVVVHDCISE
ncbi:hypothetical protein [Thiomicrospira sp.]|uniref:hypothetical protein n=1 Tax=Thiomicrospira sp. TaxID=935 RepID=UPI002F959CC1